MPRPLFPLIAPLKFLNRDSANLLTLGDNMTFPQQKILETVETVMTGGGDVRVVGGTREFTRPSPVRIIILKARQMGVSTLTEAIAFSTAMVRPFTRSLIVSHDLDSSEHLLDMTRRYWETSWYARDGIYTPKHLAGNRLGWHENDSSLRITTAKNLAGGRSHTLHFIHASEAAFWEKAKELMKGLNQAMPRQPLTFQFVESTANGYGNWYKDTWDAAVAGDNAYLPLFYAWWQHTAYTADHVHLGHLADKALVLEDDEERALDRAFRRMGWDDRDIRSRLIWRREIVATECDGDIDTFHQEYPSCLAAGTRVSTQNGVVPIEQVGIGDRTPNGKVLAVTEQPPCRVVRVTCANGRSVDATWHHPLVAANGVLVPAAGSLGVTLTPAAPTPATRPAVSTAADGLFTSSINITGTVARFLGYFMGDGSVSGGTLSVACDRQDDDVIADVTACFKRFGLTPSTRIVGTKRGGVEVRAGSKPLIEQFRRHGWVTSRPDGKLVRHVHVPECVWRSPRHIIIEFLSALFEADGFSNRTQWDVRLFTRHEQFACDVALLLAAVGLSARNRKSQTGWTVSLSSSEAAKFHEVIGFRGIRKRAAVPPHRPQRPRVNEWEVVAVEELGEHATYDLSIDGRPYFDANGLLSHNTPEEAFVNTGRNVFNPKHLNAAYEPIEGVRGTLFDKRGRVEFVPDRDGKLTVFRKPRDASWYMVGADAAKQAKGDFAVAEVIDRTTWEQVAEWRDDVDPVTFAEQIILLGRWYNEAMLCPETNMSGGAVAEIIRSSYDNVYMHRSDEKVRGQMSNQYGFNTNVQTKPEAIGNVKRALLDRHNQGTGVTIHSRVLYDEAKGYVLTDTGQYANSGSENAEHDDTVMAWALAITATVHEADSDDRPDLAVVSRAVAKGKARRLTGRDAEDAAKVRRVAAHVDAELAPVAQVTRTSSDDDDDEDDDVVVRLPVTPHRGRRRAYDDTDEYSAYLDEGGGLYDDDPW